MGFRDGNTTSWRGAKKCPPESRNESYDSSHEHSNEGPFHEEMHHGCEERIYDYRVGPLNDRVLKPLEENEQYTAKLEQDIMQGFRDEVAITMRDLCKRVENQIAQFKDM
nr:hypothetical protein Iba_chr14bCG11110 [Ipomoea batatas]GMD88165.1 hypothetical protein Iba_chr14cCG4440 [Ipomoea batatas]